MNPGDKGLDWSFSRPGGAAVAGAGYKFAFCYVSPGANKKNIDAGELADLHAHGLEVGLYFESSATRMLAGQAAGAQDAATAFAARDALGLTCPIWFADDENNPAQDSAKMPYCAGVASHGQPWEVYGSGHLIDLVASTFGRTHGGHVSSWGKTSNAGFQQEANYHGPIPGTDDLTLIKADTLGAGDDMTPEESKNLAFTLSIVDSIVNVKPGTPLAARFDAIEAANKSRFSKIVAWIAKLFPGRAKSNPAPTP